MPVDSRRPPARPRRRRSSPRSRTPRGVAACIPVCNSGHPWLALGATGASAVRLVLRTSTHAGTLTAQSWTGFGATGCFSSASTTGGTRIRSYSCLRRLIWPISTR